MNIIFVCTGNTCRSPLAEVIAKAIFAEKGVDAQVISRGLAAETHSPASYNSRKCAEEMGLSLEDFTSNQITYEDIEWADIIITMTKMHKEYLQGICDEKGVEIYTLAEAAGEYIDVSDPFGGDIDAYRACAEQIYDYVNKIALKLV